LAQLHNYKGKVYHIGQLFFDAPKKKATYSNNKVLGNYNAVLAIDGSFFLSLWPWQKNNTPRFFFLWAI